jgi:hypothetical protein
MSKEVIDEGEAQDPEPPPTGHSGLTGIFATETPFGDPPNEAVTLVGEVPWELAKDEPEASEPG